MRKSKVEKKNVNGFSEILIKKILKKKSPVWIFKNLKKGVYGIFFNLK